MTMTSTDPYAESYHAYRAAGWTDVLPLPYRRKIAPPTGYTGYTARTPSYADCATWADNGPQNIALRLPDTVIGIDVDNYANKGGGATLQRLVDEHGPLPATWLSTSRGDGISGIRLFRVPAGIKLITVLPGIEIIQPHHRYVVCWPSIHPEGAAYEWVDEATGSTDTVPPLDALPELPTAWVDALRDDKPTAEKADIDADSITRFLAGLPTGEPCQHILSAAGYAMSGGNRHDTYNGAVLGVTDSGRAGCPGAVTALNRLRKSFIAEVTALGDTGRSTLGEAAAEWARNLAGAVAIATATHPEQGAGCPDDYLAELILAEQADDKPVDNETDDQRALAYQKQVARKAAEMQLLDDARQMLATRQAGQAPTLSGLHLPTFLSQPDQAVAYRIDRLWPIGGRVLLAAAAKAGKTTMVTNLLTCLADGGDFLGIHKVAPVTAGRTIVYLNMEVGENQIRRWLRRTGIRHADRIIVENLRGRNAALTLATEQGRRRVSEWLRSHNAEIVILDPLAPLLGALGLEENENSHIARFFSWWSQVLHDAGVTDDFICHHAGWDGTRSRGASRLVDEPDAVWTISRDKATDDDGDDVYDLNEPRFLKAVGRDVEVPEALLKFDGVTGLLSIGEGNRKQLRADRKHAKAETVIMRHLGAAGPANQNTLTRTLGLNYGEAKDAVERLVIRGLVTMSKVGQANVYTLCTQPTPPTPTDTRCQVSVTDTTLYKGVGTTDGQTPSENQ